MTRARAIHILTFLRDQTVRTEEEKEALTIAIGDIDDSYGMALEEAPEQYSEAWDRTGGFA